MIKYPKTKKITKEQLKQSEKISELIAEISKLTIRIQQLEKVNEELQERISFKEGHMREKENKINMIRSIVAR